MHEMLFPAYLEHVKDWGQIFSRNQKNVTLVVIPGALSQRLSSAPSVKKILEMEFTNH